MTEWFETSYSNYFISKDGQVMKRYKGKDIICNLCLGKNGYLHFSAGRKDGKVNVHRVMGETFLPNPNNLRNIDHIDRNKCNNKLDNLRWFSQQDNMLNRDGLLGVGLCSDRNRWYARAGNAIIGYFHTEAEAKACKYGYLKAKDIHVLKSA